jgi:hypothetical protein
VQTLPTGQSAGFDNPEWSKDAALRLVLSISARESVRSKLKRQEACPATVSAVDSGIVFITTKEYATIILAFTIRVINMTIHNNKHMSGLTRAGLLLSALTFATRAQADGLLLWT